MEVKHVRRWVKIRLRDFKRERSLMLWTSLENRYLKVKVYALSD